MSRMNSGPTNIWVSLDGKLHKAHRRNTPSICRGVSAKDARTLAGDLPPTPFIEARVKN